jgi:hypothetical protein
MEQINLTQPEKKQNQNENLRRRLKRFLIASTVPLSLLAFGCGGQTAPKTEVVPDNSKIEKGDHNKEIEKAEGKMFLECLIRVAGSPESVDVLDNGDLVVRVGGSDYFRLNDEAKEKVLSVAKQNIANTDLGLSFKQAEIEIQTQAVKQAIINFGQSVSFDQLPIDLQQTEKVRQGLSDQMSGQETETKSKASPEAQDFL